MPMETLHELFEHELNDIYTAENLVTQALQESSGQTKNREVKRMLQEHKKETQNQIKRLRQVFKAIGARPSDEPCPGMDGLIKEKKLFLRQKPTPQLLDFFTIGAGEKMERYEITAYEGLIDLANRLGLEDAVEPLEENLREEEAMYERLHEASQEFDVSALLGEEAEGEEWDEEEVA